MAEFVTVMREFDRMCVASSTVCDCAIDSAMQGYRIARCEQFLVNHPKEAEKIIMDWAAEHPVETMKDRFFKMFPDAPVTKNGFPRGCPSSLGWTEGCSKNKEIENCVDCWNRPYEEKTPQRESK